MRRVPIVGSLVAVAIAGIVVANPGFSAAQAAGPLASPVVMDPAECKVEPRSVDELLDLVYAADGTQNPLPATPAAIPSGKPADAKTVEDITAVTREIYACDNAGDLLRVLSFMSDDAAQTFGTEPGLPREDAEAFLGATPEALPEEERITLVSIHDVQVLDDGRVGAWVVEEDPAEDGPSETFVIFVKVDDHYLVDVFIEPEDSTEATPEATATS
jgi:ketosteroid isomerase-like protein